MKKKLFKNKTQMVIYYIIFFICIALFIIIGKTDFHKDEDSESTKFSNLYKDVQEDNLYIFCNASDVLNILNSRSGVILMGFPSNIWTSYYADILNNAAKDLNIGKIYYYDFRSDRDESNGTYETIVKKLSVYAPVTDEGIQNIMAPTVLIVKNGSVIAYFDDTAIVRGTVTPDIYYTENQKALIYNNFKNALSNYIE